MARSTVITKKRSKKAKASKLRWEKIKKQQAQLSASVSLFGDPDATIASHDEQEPLTTDSPAAVIYPSESLSFTPESEYENTFFRESDNKLWTYSKSNCPQKECGTISSDECDRIDKHKLEYESVAKKPCIITGNRIVDLGYVLESTLDIQHKHAKACTFGKLCVKNEIRASNSLVSTVVLCCTACDKTFTLDTEKPSTMVSSINIGAVWGTLATGSTYTHCSEFLGCLDIPMMSEKKFNEIETNLGMEWKSSLWRSMETAGAEEKAHAINMGQTCPDGTPWITVYVDGSWSKRSYGTNFNALSGMIGIIGQHTGKLLYLAVRNKFCCICARADNQNITPPSHVCHKNWSESAPAMEADMAVEGFSVSESMHGVRYNQFVADGDSSVYAKLKQKVSYGAEIKKIECTNHAVKNYGKHLYRIKKDTHINVSGRKLLTAGKIKLLQKRVKCSIYEHSQNDRDITLLRKDLKNGLHHVYGDHSECRQGICNSLEDQSKNQIPQLKSTSIYNHLQGALELLVRKAHLLIQNETNNRAERLMNIVARFNMGKRLNLIQRGSYERRVYLAGLRYNKKFDWHSSPYKRVTKNSPGQHYKLFISKSMAKANCAARKRLFPSNTPTVNSKKRKLTSPNIDYGVNAETPEEDADILTMHCTLVLDRLKVSLVERDEIQQNSVGQFGNPVYETERRDRLTASLFGRVIKRRPYTPCHNIVKSCLSNAKFYSEATDYGILKEQVAINLFEQKTNKNVKKSGLWIDLDHCFLGASPDGLIGDDAILEVKCLYSAHELNASTIDEVIQLKKSMICLETKGGVISLKRTHSYYYQIQGQLNITRRSHCYFVVYVNDQIDIFIEEIQRDVKFWTEEMLPKLKQFYTDCIAPEIVRNNMGKGKRCIDPSYILNAISEYDKKKRTPKPTSGVGDE